MIFEALPGVLGNGEKRVFIAGEQGNKGQILRGTGEQKQYRGKGNIRKQIFDFWGAGEQANLFQGNKGTGIPPGMASFLTGYQRLGNLNIVFYCRNIIGLMGKVAFQITEKDMFTYLQIFALSV